MNQYSKPFIAVRPATPDQYARAESLASELKIPIALENEEEFRFLLICGADSLALRLTGSGKTGPVKAGFADPSMLYRLKHSTSRRLDLARAVGLKKGWQPRVIDATAGLGRDGFILAYLGCRVQMLERSPILAALINDGLEKARNSAQTAGPAARIKLTCADSIEFLGKIKKEDRPDVIYLDPMYPERTKGSLVKKEMRILRSLVGDDPDAPKLLEIALHRASNRVVVKRPRLAPTLGGRQPSHAITGKTSRYDVYLT